MSVMLLDKDCPEQQSVKQYYQEIQQFDRLSPQEVTELAKGCAAGDEEAICRMVNCNLRLVFSVAMKYRGRGVPLQDLIQEGSIGLLIAAKKFDYTRQVQFSTYATKWIRQRIQRCIMNHSELIRVPVRAQELMTKIRMTHSRLKQELGQEPDVESIAVACDLDVSKVKEYMDLFPEICSIDVTVGDDEDTLQMLLEDVHAPKPQEELVRRELERTIAALMEHLTQRQQLVLRLRFGMEDGTCYSQSAIAEKMGVSKERIRQIEGDGMKKLRKHSAGLGLEDYLTDE